MIYTSVAIKIINYNVLIYEKSKNKRLKCSLLKKKIKKNELIVYAKQYVFIEAT